MVMSAENIVCLIDATSTNSNILCSIYITHILMLKSRYATVTKRETVSRRINIISSVWCNKGLQRKTIHPYRATVSILATANNITGIFDTNRYDFLRPLTSRISNTCMRQIIGWNLSRVTGYHFPWFSSVSQEHYLQANHDGLLSNRYLFSNDHLPVPSNTMRTAVIHRPRPA
jgi:hypothetical protein